MRSLISVGDLTRADSERLLDAAEGLIGKRSGAGTGQVIGLLFFEPSTRTRFGFASAAQRFGLGVVTLDEFRQSPLMSAAESLEDTLRAVTSYVDVVCIRHPWTGSAQLAAQLGDVPVINCGNGKDEHPSQALIDLLAIRRRRGRIDGVSVGIVGDLYTMRASHSLLMALGLYDDVTVRCMAPEELRMPQKYVDGYRASGNKFDEVGSLDLHGLDVVYMAGFVPVTDRGTFDDSARSRYRLGPPQLVDLSDNAMILCPLPRIDEIDPAVDSSPLALYFEQSRLALWVRGALLLKMLACTREAED